MKKTSMQRMTSAALLVAMGIIIPMFSPLKIVIEPASFTLASHVPIFMSVFISPATAVAVTIGTALGFFLGGFPITIVLRAASHIVFVLCASYYLKYYKDITQSPFKTRVFSFIIGLIHTICEVIVVSFFYFGGSFGDGYYDQGFLYSVIYIIGIGGLVHSMVDFEIAFFITKAITKKREIALMFGSINYDS